MANPITLGWPVILQYQRKHRTTADYYRKTIEKESRIGLCVYGGFGDGQEQVEKYSEKKGKRNKSIETSDG